MKKLAMFLLLLVLCLSMIGCSHEGNASDQKAKSKTATQNQNTKQKTSDQQQQRKAKAEAPPAKPKVVDWTKPTGGSYPTNLSDDKDLWIDVSVEKQRAYIKNDDHTLYTMIVSTGLDTKPDDSTPKGTYHIQPEKGTWFYSNGEKEGAEYWVSWKNHGEFLFHTVPMDADKKIIKSEAEKLGHKASHGCVRLSIPDAKWIYNTIPTNTKVVIE
ncbi:hypothetical protein GCM10011391_18520 [Pullulanibacillus camelliae]|uniref:L,D-TPase catalytic domain-containing protein n=1 Tax=Pullulanibacillus camelliae TaxID=1707096 RepID=A0A8J2W083_9BACL|nr:L,D-transpeptidase [Pullulanibacillus camelliae]GGE39999.1 hypothetical protein GCM10011391_18520 [Pullulanibacillus camelliae]